MADFVSAIKKQLLEVAHKKVADFAPSIKKLLLEDQQGRKRCCETDERGGAGGKGLGARVGSQVVK
eukprot:31938-Chlamydomonas_euryale.AAC.2